MVGEYLETVHLVLLNEADIGILSAFLQGPFFLCEVSEN